MRAANLPSLRGLITSGYHLRIATAKAISEAEVYFRRGSSGETAQTAALKAFFEAAIDAVEAAEVYSQVVLPKNTVAPAITGTAKVGETLTVTNGTWTGTSPTYSREWLRDGVVIEGETEATYVLVEDDEGAVISVRVTATNARGSVSALSNETDPVEPEEPEEPVDPEDPEDPEEPGDPEEP